MLKGLALRRGNGHTAEAHQTTKRAHLVTNVLARPGQNHCFHRDRRRYRSQRWAVRTLTQTLGMGFHPEIRHRVQQHPQRQIGIAPRHRHPRISASLRRLQS